MSSLTVTNAKSVWVRCHKCLGTGRDYFLMFSNKCSFCKGKGLERIA